MAQFILENALKKKYPEYDPNRYRFKRGDVVKTLDGAVVVITSEGILDVRGYVHKQSVKYRIGSEVTVPYSDLPKLPKDGFTPYQYKLNKSLKWKTGDIVEDINGTIAYLYGECDHQCFYGYVLESDMNHYIHTGIYLENPYRDYVLRGA